MLTCFNAIYLQTMLKDRVKNIDKTIINIFKSGRISLHTKYAANYETTSLMYNVVSLCIESSHIVMDNTTWKTVKKVI